MRAEDEAVFRQVAEAHRDPLRRAAVRLTGNWNDADDLAQQTLIKLYTSWPLRDEKAAPAWLTRTLVRSFLDQTRRHSWKRERTVAQLPERAAPETGDGIDDRLINALDKLAPRQRACIILRFLEDYSIDQTADVLGCSPGTVRGYTARGLNALRGALGNESTYIACLPGGSA